MRLDRLQCFASRIDSERFIEVLVEYAVGEHRQSGDVIEVRVGKKNMPNRLKILQLEVAYAGAGIDQHVVVDEHCGGA